VNSLSFLTVKTKAHPGNI